jgi:hypothetical protein
MPFFYCVGPFAELKSLIEVLPRHVKALQGEKCDKLLTWSHEIPAISVEQKQGLPLVRVAAVTNAPA